MGGYITVDQVTEVDREDRWSLTGAGVVGKNETCSGSAGPPLSIGIPWVLIGKLDFLLRKRLKMKKPTAQMIKTVKQGIL